MYRGFILKELVTLLCYGCFENLVPAACSPAKLWRIHVYVISYYWSNEKHWCLSDNTDEQADIPFVDHIKTYF